MRIITSGERPAGALQDVPNAVHGQIARIARALGAQPATTPNVDNGRTALIAVVGLTLLINLMALVTPAITLAIFDYVARDGAHISLALLCGTGGLAVTHEMLLRRNRRAILSEHGARIVSILAGRLFRGVMGERALRGAEPIHQVSAFRDLRELREMLLSPVSSAILDAPFAVLFIVLLLFLAGPVGLAPLVAILAHAAVAAAVRPRVRLVQQRSARQRERLRIALQESASKAPSLDELGARSAWAARVEGLAVSVAMRREKETLAEGLLESLSFLITALAVIATLWLSAREVMAGTLTIGAAMAAVMLAWRAAAPLELLLQSTSELRGVWRIARRARASGAPKPETRLQTPSIAGRIEVRGLSVRIDESAHPVLRGVSFDVAPGELVAVCGVSGAGKSALLSALLGLHPADAGAVCLDGRDIRSMDPDQLRLQIGYAPQRPTLFHGTVAQNIRLYAPGVEESQIRRALAMAGVALPHMQLAQGLETRLNSGGSGQIDEGLRMKLMLAGVYAKQAKLLLLDDPGANLDREGDRRLLETLKELRGATTIILVTNRPSHMRACDRIIRLDHGMVVTDGRVEQVMAR